MGVGDEQLGQEIVVVGRHADPALAAAALLAIGRERRALDVAEPRHGDDHVLLLDQVLDVDLVVSPSSIVVRRGVAKRSLTATSSSFSTSSRRSRERRMCSSSLMRSPSWVSSSVILAALELGQALQAQVQDRLRLALGQAVAVRPGRPAAASSGASSARCSSGATSPSRQSRAVSSALAVAGSGAAADQRDDRIDVGDRDREAEQDVRPLARAREVVGAAPRDHLLAELEEGAQHLQQVELRRPAAGRAPPG